jgi:hypothetical protein
VAQSCAPGACMTLRRLASLVEIALAVLMAGFGSSVLAAASFYARTYESYDLASAILTGALLLISAAGFAFAAWSLRGRSRSACTKHWLALIVALSALAGKIWGLHIERSPTPLSASRGSSIPINSPALRSPKPGADTAAFCETGCGAAARTLRRVRSPVHRSTSGAARAHVPAGRGLDYCSRGTVNSPLEG